MSEKLYAERDIVEQGDYYSRHTSAMTGEGLHSKSDIAAELAHRDIEITRLQSEVERLRGRCGELEEFSAFAQQTAERELDPDYVPPRTAEAMFALLEASRQITGEVEACDYENPWLLRKQAEAVERATLICRRDGIRPEVSTASCPVYALKDYAQRLRQQAAENENGQN